MKQIIKDLEKTKKKDKIFQLEKQKTNIKKLVENALGPNGNKMKKLIIDAVKDNKKEFLLITLPVRDPKLFQHCTNDKNKYHHVEKECSFIQFVSHIIHEKLDKQFFDIDLECYGEFWTYGETKVNIYIKFSYTD